MSTKKSQFEIFKEGMSGDKRLEEAMGIVSPSPKVETPVVAVEEKPQPQPQVAEVVAEPQEERVHLGVRVDPSLKTSLMYLKIKTGISATDLVTEAIKDLLDKYNK